VRKQEHGSRRKGNACTATPCRRLHYPELEQGGEDYGSEVMG